MIAGNVARNILKYGSISAASCVAFYAVFLALIATPFLQTHIIYLHKIQMTWFKDLNTPELWGFLHNQITPFPITTPDGHSLYAWHVLPLELYRKHEQALLAEPSGFVSDFDSRVAFKLLRDDPEARLILHFHGAAGTVASGYRPANYRALSVGSPGKIHVLTIDYRGFGRSSNVTPSESGLIVDALAVVDWAMNVARIPPSRLMVFGQSIGTAVSLAVIQHFALQNPPVSFAGAMLVAPFVNSASLAATYSIASTIPLLSPVARFPILFKQFSTLIHDKWLSSNRLGDFIGTSELNNEKYRVTLIHAEDDYDIPFHRTQSLFWSAVNATVPGGITYKDLDLKKATERIDNTVAGSVMEWRTDNGVIREQILKTGLHDVIMGYPVISLEAMRILTASDPSFS
ncbi:abhydrolase domain-containing protein 12 [Nannizzia gypsea CBS 118893]|uniref:Abhydrolase domain-containing protein 12 n=1 Tax=Arthroderma gypseum (strain ATCC MYA-4604 / CBS 118893) TaxID=535722 RepID=E4UW67_ARTGP|nr:abhydrolase domain-containing protein 12 [Nannizzia gypsea CBS 118893]EFR01675.1 abhydrolase domain-containing protein 12 [Nannizzia gypsea CBS 118893]